MKKKAIILLVEDNHMDIELTLDAFKEVHLDNVVRVVETGEEALDYLLGRSKFTDRSRHPIPDLVLLDIKLPGISGLDVLKTIKQTPGLKRLPVIILSSSQDEGDRMMSYDYGVNSYLVKPIVFQHFLEAVKTLTEYWISLNINAPIDEIG